MCIYSGGVLYFRNMILILVSAALSCQVGCNDTNAKSGLLEVILRMPLECLELVQSEEDPFNDSELDSLINSVRSERMKEIRVVQRHDFNSTCDLVLISTKGDVKEILWAENEVLISEEDPALTLILQNIDLDYGSNVFIARRSSASSEPVFNVDEVYRKGRKDVSRKFCGVLSASLTTCDIFEPHWTRRRNLHGMRITASYDGWSPFCTTDESGRLKGGIMFDIFQTLAKTLNFKPTFVLNEERGIWGNEVNGSWTGMVGAVARGEVDTSIAGIAPTATRSAVIDFSVGVATSKIGLYVRKPTGSEISMQAFTSEFNVMFLSALHLIR